MYDASFSVRVRLSSVTAACLLTKFRNARIPPALPSNLPPMSSAVRCAGSTLYGVQGPGQRGALCSGVLSLWSPCFGAAPRPFFVLTLTLKKTNQGIHFIRCLPN